MEKFKEVHEKIADTVRNFGIFSPSIKERRSSGTGRKRRIRALLVQAAIHCVFVFVISVATFGMINPMRIYTTEGILGVFIYSTLSDESTKTFMDIGSYADFWEFMAGNLIQGLYWNNDPAGQKLPKKDLGTIFHANKMIGPARLTMLRVMAGSCSVDSGFNSQIGRCDAEYSSAAADKSDIIDKDGSMKGKYSKGKGNDYKGKVATYDDSGYRTNLNLTDPAASLEIILTMRKSNTWLTLQTRAVFVDFSVYNVAVNLFSVVKLVFEFPATGGVLPSYRIQTVKLYRYSWYYDILVGTHELVSCVAVFFYIVDNLVEIILNFSAYISSYWSILDFFILFAGLWYVMLLWVGQPSASNNLDALIKTRTETDYVDLEPYATRQLEQDTVTGVLLFLVYIKVVKYLNISKSINQLTLTLTNSSLDLMHAILMFFYQLFAFASFGFLSFGSDVKEFTTFTSSLCTVLRIVIGNYREYAELYRLYPVVGAIYYVAVVFFSPCLLFNIILVIIDERHASVKAGEGNQSFLYLPNVLCTFIPQCRVKDAEISLLAFAQLRKEMISRGYLDDDVMDVLEEAHDRLDRPPTDDEIREMYDELDTTRREALQKKDPGTVYSRVGAKWVLYGGLGLAIRQCDIHPCFRLNIHGNGLKEPKMLREDVVQYIKQYERIKNALNPDDPDEMYRRLDRMFLNLDQLSTQVSGSIAKFNDAEKMKARRIRAVLILVDSIQQEKKTTEAVKKEYMIRLIREETERMKDQ